LHLRLRDVQKGKFPGEEIGSPAFRSPLNLTLTLLLLRLRAEFQDCVGGVQSQQAVQVVDEHAPCQAAFAVIRPPGIYELIDFLLERHSASIVVDKPFEQEDRQPAHQQTTENDAHQSRHRGTTLTIKPTQMSRTAIHSGTLPVIPDIRVKAKAIT
jgi:superfamily II RNA helicase